MRLLMAIFGAGCAPSEGPTATPGITILNHTGIEDSALRQWTSHAASQMRSRQSQVIAVAYPVGGYIGPVEVDWHPAGRIERFEVLLSEAQVDDIMSALSDFLSAAPCMDRWRQKDDEEMLRGWLEVGYDAASQITVCDRQRIVMVAQTSEQSEAVFEGIWYHELYHSFQQQLLACELAASPGQEFHWVVEAGAAYAATAYQLAAQQREGELKDVILQAALNAISEGSDTLTDPGIAEKGAAAFLYMVEQGWLSESDILNGALYQDCGFVTDFQDGSPNITTVKERYAQIACTDAGCYFTEE